MQLLTDEAGATGVGALSITPVNSRLAHLPEAFPSNLRYDEPVT